MSNKTLKKRNDILKLPYLVLVVSLLVTLGATYFFYQNSQTKDKTRFTTEVNKSKTILENKVSGYMTMLKSIRAYIEADPNVNREKFSVFVKNLEMQNSYTGIQGLGYVSSIETGKRQELIEKMNAAGNKDFKIFPENSLGENSYVVVYLESFAESNQQAIGFDMSSEPNRLQAMNAARDSGLIVASSRVTLVESGEKDSQPGFLFYLPIYNNGGVPQNVEDRRRLLKGFVYSPFRAGDFLNDVQKTIASNYLAISIYDGEISEEKILARTSPSKDSVFSKINEINVAGRKWIVEYNSLPDFEAQSSTNLTPLIFVSGSIFSLLLFGMTYLESYARSRAEKIAANLKKSENERAALLKSEQKARETAENANHAKDEFIANVSHELRTPLNSIAGWSRILQAESLPPAMKQQALQKIDKNLRTQTKIIEDLLDFSQITTCQSLVATEPVGFSDVFEEAFQEIVSTAEEKGIIIEKHNTLNGQKVYGDYPHLKKVIKNLLSNAVKFTGDGGKVIAEAKADQKIVEVRIADSGKGIEPSFLPHIFEHFKQADSSSTRSYGGLGIGLAISRQIIESYGGEIKAKSEGEGKGTTFIVKLPYIHS
jgi:two-component system, OmpR family, sensor kinase